MAKDTALLKDGRLGRVILGFHFSLAGVRLRLELLEFGVSDVGVISGT